MAIRNSSKIGIPMPNIGEELFFLDQFPNPNGHCYSLRKLSSTTTKVIRVRRDSDNSEADFTSDEITDGTLLSFCAAEGEGSVTGWYDQSGSNDLTEPSASLQPKIVSGGAVLIENGKPCVEFGTDDSLRSLYQAPYVNAYNLFMVCKQISAGYTYGLAGGGSANSFRWDGTSALMRGNGTDISYISGWGVQELYTNVQSNGFFSSAYVNGVLKANGSNGSTQIARAQLGRASDLSNPSSFRIQEFILYLAATPTSAPIEANINSYYSIY
tara:strand:+ start:1848 stop:2657 length:810 start_codon:yes stop_codon:yes gene_type:complete